MTAKPLRAQLAIQQRIVQRAVAVKLWRRLHRAAISARSQDVERRRTGGCFSVLTSSQMVGQHHS
jgi:hypothetical protein